MTKKKIEPEKRGPGRPKLETPRVKVPVRPFAPDKQRWERQAHERGLSLAAWVVLVCNDAAARAERTAAK
jgi:hypothetical protein